MKSLLLSLFLLLASIFIWLLVAPPVAPLVGGAPITQAPYCAGWWQAHETQGDTLILAPIIANRIDRTRVEVWVHTLPGYPKGPLGWARGAENLPAGHVVMWFAPGLSPGQHAVTAEVFEGAERVDGWERSPLFCLAMVEVKRG